MPPRRYSLEKRQAAVEQTRRRIVQATMELHHLKGIRDTSYEDIADRADVALATVYRHFPTLDHLVNACGALTHRVICPPDPLDAPRLFANVTALPARVRRLVGEFDDFYARSAQTWAVVLRDCHRVPQLQQSLDEHRRTVELYVREALRPLDPPEQTVQAVCALLDFATWNSMAQRGIDRAGVADLLRRLILCCVNHTTRNAGTNPARNRRRSS